MLIIAGAGAAGWAIYNTTQASTVAAPPATTQAIRNDDPNAATGDPNAELPPNHPAIGNGTGGGNAMMPPADNEPAALSWKPPAAWQVAPNPNSMRVATYHPPLAKGDTAQTEVVVARAGGSIDANIERWIGQFEGAGKDTRSKEKIAGFDTTFVEVSGTYQGGMSMSDQAPKAEPGWTLHAAIVETPGMSYFFKMIGPSASVAAARAGFDAMIRGIQPAAPAH